MVSVFLYLLQFPSYDVINDVIMSDADSTPGREPRRVAAIVVCKMQLDFDRNLPRKLVLTRFIGVDLFQLE